jgi:hypothetical protein
MWVWLTLLCRKALGAQQSPRAVSEGSACAH